MVTPDNKSQNERVSGRDSDASPGTQLRQAREAIGATLAVVSARTRISETTLYHLENDMFDEFAVELFLKGHLRSYARELGLNPDDLVLSYERFVGIHVPVDSDASFVDPLDPSAELVPTHDNLPATQQELIRKSQEQRILAQSLRNSASKALSSSEPQVSPAALSGKHRKVIGRFDSQELRAHVRRGPQSNSEAGRTSAIRLSKPIFSIAERIFNNNTLTIPEDLSTAEASAPIIRQRIHNAPFLSESSQHNAIQLRRSAQAYRNETNNLPQKSKLERAIPQLKQFGAKHYIAIIVVIVLSVITAGLLSGNRATAQDPAKFPKNSQDSWELERQAEQTRWLLEQPDGQQQVDSSKDNDQ